MCHKVSKPIILSNPIFKESATSFIHGETIMKFVKKCYVFYTWYLVIVIKNESSSNLEN